MAKALGLIGNFKGKLGNTVGYSLKDSNNKQTQGVRVYQPVVRNPKTYAQAEQRAKLAPINEVYRCIKMVIDRGQEGKAYGNKSRLAWLKDALKAYNSNWTVKGTSNPQATNLPITKGSLACDIPFSPSADYISINVVGVTAEGTTTLGQLSSALIAAYPALKDGDQITFVEIEFVSSKISSVIDSIVLDSTSSAAIPSFISINDGEIIVFETHDNGTNAAVVVSREGDNGTHLRSTSSLHALGGYVDSYDQDATKKRAIESYMSQGANTDWAEESLM